MFSAEEHGDIYISCDTGVSEGYIGVDFKSYKDDYITDKDLDVDEVSLADALGVQLSTE